MRSSSSAVPVLIILTLACSLPPVLAQQTSITNVHIPNNLLYDLEGDSTFPPATVTATVSYSGSQPGFYLQVGVFQLEDGSLVKGSASANPEQCVQNASQTFAACTTPVKSSAGTGDFSFVLHSRPKRLWDLALVAILANNSLGILADSESDYTFTINVSIALTLQITAPNPVIITVDGVNRSLGSVSLLLITGSHNVSVPETVQLNNDTKLKFEEWSDGLMDANRTVLLNHYVNLQAIYLHQYPLTIESPTPVSGAGWYDQGTNATFSVDSKTQPMVGVLGLLGGRLEFQGWYDHDQLITRSRAGSIQMDAPHLIQARWYSNYTVPVALLISMLLLLGYALLTHEWGHSKVKRRTKSKHS